MLLQVPFYLNRGHRCAQTAMKSVLKAVALQKIFSYNELEELTQHSKGKITFPCQIASAFLRLGMDFRYYIKPNGLSIILSADAIKLARESYGNYTEDLLSKTDTESLKNSAILLVGKKEVIEKEKKPTITELEELVKQERIPLCLINYDVFVGRENKFNGHYIIITGFSNGDIIYHDNGPKNAGANKISSVKRFEQAWDLCFFDHNLIVVSTQNFKEKIS